MLRLYLDKDAMDHELVLAPRTRGIDVVAARDEGMLGRSDRVIVGQRADGRRRGFNPRIPALETRRVGVG
jgi:hypothetical protein